MRLGAITRLVKTVIIADAAGRGYFLDLENNTFGLFQVDENAK